MDKFDSVSLINWSKFISKYTSTNKTIVYGDKNRFADDTFFIAPHVINASHIIHITDGLISKTIITAEPMKCCGLGIDRNKDSFTSTSFTSNGSISNVPSRMGYTATLLSSGKIVFIGGSERLNNFSDVSDVDMRQLSIYDTRSNSWSSMITQNGDFVENRYWHSAVLTPDERIIIFGGFRYNGEGLVREPLAILDTKKNPYEWFIPETTNITSPPTLAFHSATLVGNYMLVSNFASKIPSTALFYILDTRNYTWTTQFEPEISPSSVKKLVSLLELFALVFAFALLLDF